MHDFTQAGGGLSEVEEMFILDAGNAIATLEEMYENPDAIGDEQLDIYEITVHGMKSAFLNIGENGLSDFAKTLEQAAKNKDLAQMAEETPEFLEAMKELLAVMKARAG